MRRSSRLTLAFSPIEHDPDEAPLGRLQGVVSWLAFAAWQSLGCARHLSAMVASVQRIKPHEVFDRHRTETGAHDVREDGAGRITYEAGFQGGNRQPVRPFRQPPKRWQFASGCARVALFPPD